MNWLRPDECIDSGVCEPECSVDAIKPDTELGREKWLSLHPRDELEPDRAGTGGSGQRWTGS